MNRTALHIIFLLSLLSVLLFPSCEKEQAMEEPLIDEPPGIGVGEENVSDITALIQPQHASQTFTYGIKKKVGRKEIRLYTVEGHGEVTLRHSVYPFYSFEKNSSNGDYYIVQSEVSVANTDMYQGYKQEWFDKMSNIITNICGYYMREMRVSYELKDKNGHTVGEFPVNHSPTPVTTINSNTYTSGFSWSLGGQIRIGTDTALKSKPLLFSFSYDNAVKRNIQDMDVRNSSTDRSPHYAFILNNLPTYETKNPYTPRVPPTPLSINTHSYFQEFVWRVPTTKDSQGDDVRFSLHQKVEIDYGICYSVTHFDQTVGPDAYKLEEYVETIRDSSVIDLIPPCRIPMGTLKITNQNKGQYVTQIAIAKKGQQPQVVSKGSVAYGKSFEIFLDVGQYDVTFKMGTTSKNVKTYKLGYDFAEISKDEVLELFSDFDFISL